MDEGLTTGSRLAHAARDALGEGGMLAAHLPGFVPRQAQQPRLPWQQLP